MTDYIRRADAIEAACNEMDWLDDGCVEERKTMIKDALSALPSADAEQVTGKLKNPCDSLLTDDSAECKEQKSKLESADVAPKIDHDREWIIGCIKHDGFIKTDRFDKANQIILEALSADAEFADLPDIPRAYYERIVGNMAHEINMLKEKLESADAVHGWKIGKPTEQGKYMVTLDSFGHKHIDLFYYGKPLMPNRKVRGKCWYRSDDEWGDVVYDDKDVLAWMPLPKPYREDGEA